MDVFLDVLTKTITNKLFYYCRIRIVLCYVSRVCDCFDVFDYKVEWGGTNCG